MIKQWFDLKPSVTLRSAHPKASSVTAGMIVRSDFIELATYLEVVCSFIMCYVLYCSTLQPVLLCCVSI